MYSVIEASFRLGFNSEEPPLFFVIGLIITGFFAIDLIINFNTAYEQQYTNKLIFHRSKIATNYFKFWFWVDLISTIPFAEILALYSFRNELRSLRLVRILRIIRLLKLFRILNLNEVLNKLGVNPSIGDLVLVIFQICFIAHIFGCFWHGMAEANTATRSWLTVFEYENKGLFHRYVASVYFIITTMLTVGYGDIYPTNTGERIFAIITFLAGGVVFGTLIAKVSNIIQERNPMAAAYKVKMAEFKAFLSVSSFPTELRYTAKV
jgi:hypothetical protein